MQLDEEELRDAVLLVFANKQDLPNAMNVSDIQERLGLMELRNKTVSIHCCPRTLTLRNSSYVVVSCFNSLPN